MGKPKSSYSTAIVDGAVAGGGGAEVGVGLAVEAVVAGAVLDSGGSSLAVESFPLFAEAAEAAGTSSSFPAAMSETFVSLCPDAQLIGILESVWRAGRGRAGSVSTGAGRMVRGEVKSRRNADIKEPRHEE